MSKIIKVTPSYVPEDCNYITFGKIYTCKTDDNLGLGYTINDGGKEIAIRFNSCAHLKGNPWIIVEDQSTQSEASMKRKHYDLIIAWANGAEIEYSYGSGDSKYWKYIENPTWDSHVSYRIKPKTININGFEVPEPLYERPKGDTDIYLAGLQTGSVFLTKSCLVDNKVFTNGIAHLTKEACQKHIDALLSFTKRD